LGEHTTPDIESKPMATPTAFRPKARTVRGLLDRRGADLARERSMIAAIGAVFEQWGFEPLETPALEYAEALGKFLPDQDRPNAGVFAFEDDDRQWLALRYDLTAPLARFAAEHFDSLPKPYRRWAAGRVWRNEKPGPGRFREFTQCDADTVGAPGPTADAEIIALACAALRAAGLPGDAFAIKISSRGLLDALLAGVEIAPEDGRRLTILRAIDKLDRLGVEGVRLLLGPGRKDESGDFTRGAGLAEPEIDRVCAFLQAGRADRAQTIAALAGALPASVASEAGLRELEEIAAVLRALGVAEANAVFDPAIVRGLEYYTGPVFEAQLLARGGGDVLGSVGGGGRYDGLVARFKGQEVPATGFSVGVSRLLAALPSVEAASRAPVVVLVMDPLSQASAFAIARELREAGIAAEAYVGGSGLRAQMKYADKRGSPWVVIEGEDERARGVITLKDLALGAALSQRIEAREAWREARPAQREAPRGELVAAVRAMLAGGAA